MSLKVWIEQFRELHAKFKSGKASRDELEAYEAGRDQLARAMVSAQHLTLKPGETPRRALRVARALQVDIELPSGPFRSPTVDVSAGGFAVLVSSTAVPTESVRYKLRLPGGEPPLEGRALPLHSKAQAGALARVSFAFENLPDEQRARLEMVVFDTALALFTL